MDVFEFINEAMRKSFEANCVGVDDERTNVVEDSDDGGFGLGGDPKQAVGFLFRDDVFQNSDATLGSLNLKKFLAKEP